MTVAKAMIMVVIMMPSIMIACGINNSKTKTSTGISISTSTSSNPQNLHQCHHRVIGRHRTQKRCKKKMEEQINKGRLQKTINKVMSEVVLGQDGAAGLTVTVATAVITAKILGARFGIDYSEVNRPCRRQLLQLLFFGNLAVASIVG
jgi:hypothetical protein